MHSAQTLKALKRMKALQNFVSNLHFIFIYFQSKKSLLWQLCYLISFSFSFFFIIKFSPDTARKIHYSLFSNVMIEMWCVYYLYLFFPPNSTEGTVPRAGVRRRGERRSDHGDAVPQRRHQTHVHRPLLHPPGFRSGRLRLRRATQHGNIRHHFLARYLINHKKYCISHVFFSSLNCFN